MNNKKTIGSIYENIAADYLRKNGLTVLECNYSCRKSEIDIIAKDMDELVFVEVKYRKNDLYGLPYESVDIKKQQKIRFAAKSYLTDKKIFDDTPCRFDVISITGNDIVWIKDAF